MPSPASEDDRGYLALVELLRRNAEAMEGARATQAALQEELRRLTDETRRVGERVHEVEDVLADYAAVEKTRAEQRKESWEVVKSLARSPVVHAAAVAILGAVLNLLGLQKLL